MQELVAPAPAPGLIESFLGTLLSPIDTFRRISEEARTRASQNLPIAFGVVVFVFGLDGLRLSSTENLESAIFNMTITSVLGVLIWLLSGGVVGLVAACFDAPLARIRASFVTLGWSMVPWLFAGPVSAAQPLINGASPLLLGFLLTWMFALQIIAINQSYQMKPWQSIALAFIAPGLLFTLQFFKCLQELTTLSGLFS